MIPDISTMMKMRTFWLALLFLGIISSIVQGEELTVKDLKTGLTWQKGEPGEMSFDHAVKYCSNLKLGEFDDWRMPSIEELTTAYAIKSRFPMVSIHSYWSTTPYPHRNDNNHVLLFLDGLVFGNNRNQLIFVRCVRSEQ
jgi:Protein of unknown function (DUF1566)